MKVEIKVKYLVIAAVLIIACIWALLKLGGHKYRMEADRLNTELYEAQRMVSEYEIEVNGYKESVAQAEVLVLNRDQAIKDLSMENERIKELNIRNVSLIGELKAEIKILKDSLKPEMGDVSEKPILLKDTTSYLPLPNRFSFLDKDVDMFTFINTSGHASMGFELLDPAFNVVIGDQGFFGNKKNVVAITSDNQYINISQANVAVVNENKKPAYYVAAGSVGTVVAIVALRLLLGD